MRLDSKQVMSGTLTPNQVATGDTITIPPQRTLIFAQDLTLVTTGRIVLNTTSRMVGIL